MIYIQFYVGWNVWFSPFHRVKHRAAVKPLTFNLPLGWGWQKRNCLLEILGSALPEETPLKIKAAITARIGGLELLKQVFLELASGIPTAWTRCPARPSRR